MSSHLHIFSRKMLLISPQIPLCTGSFHRPVLFLQTMLQKHAERLFHVLGASRSTDSKTLLGGAYHLLRHHVGLCFLMESIAPSMEQRIESFFEPTLSSVFCHMLYPPSSMSLVQSQGHLLQNALSTPPVKRILIITNRVPVCGTVKNTEFNKYCTNIGG